MGKIQVVVGGQFGSEAKGSCAYWLAKREPLLGCRVGGPNAGHTAIDYQGREWKLQQVPIAALHDSGPLCIAAGSVIDPEILRREASELDAAGFDVTSRLLIDSSATILEPVHAKIETMEQPHGKAGLTARIGSTGKGVGAARSDRVMRRAKTAQQVLNGSFAIGCTREAMANYLYDGGTVQIEGTQGYGLGLHTSYYPFVTSSDCRAIDFLSQAGLSPWQRGVTLEVWIVYRTFPIRVAGRSGPLLGEMSWDELGVPPEQTTVTRKIRRVGQWDPELARQALAANGGPGGSTHVVLTFLDYIFPQLRDSSDLNYIYRLAGTFLRMREDELGQPISAVGTGPATMVSLED